MWEHPARAAARRQQMLDDARKRWMATIEADMQAAQDVADACRESAEHFAGEWWMTRRPEDLYYWVERGKTTTGGS